MAVDVKFSIIPDVSGPCRGVLKVARGLEPPESIFAFKEIDRNAKIPLATKDAEDLLPAEVNGLVKRMLPTHRDLLRERRGQSTSKAVGETTLFGEG